MTREPYLVLRDLRVWFPKRRGFLVALRKSEPTFVRAVDGIDLEVGKGEVYCLVGESGCGKTTTGKGVLRLVEPTEGDVFVGLSPGDLDQYRALRTAKDEAGLEEFRRRWSLSYKEKIRRSVRDVVLHTILVAVGLLAALGAGLGMILALRAASALEYEPLSFIAFGVVLSFFGTLPRVKLTARIPLVLMGLAVPGAMLTQAAGVAMRLASAGQPVDGGAVLAGYAALWEAGTLGSTFLEILLGALVSWYAGRLLMTFWRRRQGYEADRIRKLRKNLQIIFQDPYESLNPKHSVYDIIAEALIVNHLSGGRAETEARVEQALTDAGLRPPRDFMFRYPHELSGGQRQRVCIAGALVLEPDFLVADEPVSMLDVSIRTEIIELLLELRKTKGLTYLFITHDLSLAWVLADRIGVMYLGKIVEEGPTRELIRNPRHPYTKALVSVVPVPDPDRKHARIILKGERPDPSDVPPGCRFHPRCPVAFEKCGWTAHEVLEDLRELAVSEGVSERVGRAAVADGDVLTLDAAAEEWVKSVIATRSEEVRALKAIRSVERGPGGIRLSLHPYEEPALKAVSGDVQVSCHLFG